MLKDHDQTLTTAGPLEDGDAPQIKGDQSRIRSPLNGFGPPSLGPLAAETLRRLVASFSANNHYPSPQMWAAIADILRSLEEMSNGTAERAVHLTSLDCGIGKTQSVVTFLPVLISSPSHSDTSAVVCAGRREQVKAMIVAAKKAGLRECDFAVYTSDDKLNASGVGVDNRHNARVLFTTHAMVMKRCEGGLSFANVADFHFKNTPRDVRVWDEAITPGLALTLSNSDLSSLIRPASLHNAKLCAALSRLFADLVNRKDGERFTVPDLADDCGVDLNDLEGMFDGAADDLKITANALWFMCGKTVTVRHDGKPGNSILDYRETLPTDITPLLVLDASSRRNVRETYALWESERGGIKRLREAPKNYSPLTIHHWDVSGGKTAFRDRARRMTLIQGVANTINAKPSDRWLVVHHKDEAFEGEVRAALVNGADVAFIHWGAHEGTNDYAEVPNVILAGTLFLRPSQYEAIGRAAAGHPSSSGPFPVAQFEAVRRGEHRHMILQAAARGLVRKCRDDSCPQSDVYIIASRGSRIGEDLSRIFPGAVVVRWQPVERKLTGKVGEAVAFILERTENGAFVSDAAVMQHIGATDRSYYRRRIKNHEDLYEALEERGIAPCKQSRKSGFQHSAAHHFGTTSETP